MKIVACLLVAAVLLTGCATSIIKKAVSGKVANFTHQDLTSAAALGKQAVELGALPEQDQWGSCFNYLAERLELLQKTSGAEAEGRGLFTRAMRAHILRQILRETRPEIRAACGQVFADIMLDIGRKGLRLAPGL